MKNTLKKLFSTFRKEFKINHNKSIYEIFKEDEKIKCYQYFKKFFKKAIFLDASIIRKYSIQEAIINNPIDKKSIEDIEFFDLEFGVFKGESINFFSNYVEKIYGFDSFMGLKEDWAGTTMPKGEFKLNEMPKVNENVFLIKGNVQDTLGNFLKSKNPKIRFVHMDLDTYESSKFVLQSIKPYLIDKCIILFDELYNFSGWDVGELKALNETFDEKEFFYKAFSETKSRVVIQVKVT
jgi:hypothetical protein